MNIVYKFITQDGLKYIGSKTECTVHGNIIVDRNGKNYYGSTNSKEFFEGIKKGYTLEILEEVTDKKSILLREAHYQRMFNAVCDKKYVNKVYADSIKNVITEERWGEIINPYLETLKEFTVNNSTVARLELSSEIEGFLTYGHKVKHYLDLKESGKSFKEIDQLQGKTKYAARFLKDKRLEDFTKTFCKYTLVGDLLKGKSLIKTCEDLGVELYVVLYHMPKNFYKITRELRLAVDNGFYSREDFEKHIMYLFLKGSTRQDIAKKYLNLSISSVSRIIDKIIRNRLEINDFK